MRSVADSRKHIDEHTRVTADTENRRCLRSWAAQPGRNRADRFSLGGHFGSSLFSLGTQCFIGTLQYILQAVAVAEL